MNVSHLNQSKEQHKAMQDRVFSEPGTAARGFFASLWAIAALIFSQFLAVNGFAGSLRELTVPANSTGDEIQSALDRLVDGGEVVLSPGTYLICRPIMLQNCNLTLRGAGPSTVLFLEDGANCPVIVLGAPASPARNAIRHLRVADLVIDGNRERQQVELWQIASDGSELNNNGIDVWAVTDASIEHVVCCHCRSGGLVTAAGTRRLTVSDYTAFDNQFDGLACYLTEDSRFSGLFLHDNLGAGISLDLDFNHNVIEDARLTGNDLGVFMRSARGNTFHELEIEQSHHHGVFMAQTWGHTNAGWRLCPGTECSGNSFEDVLISKCGGNAFVVNNDSCTNNLISSARFLDNLKGGLSCAENLVTIKGLAEK
ncbi:conserved hypothetical protein [Verrucomicrobia bacterium]|nr:conserved hypothetical protein [Verrucomicrobiota bacterium]